MKTHRLIPALVLAPVAISMGSLYSLSNYSGPVNTLPIVSSTGVLQNVGAVQIGTYLELTNAQVDAQFAGGPKTMAEILSGFTALNSGSLGTAGSGATTIHGVYSVGTASNADPIDNLNAPAADPWKGKNLYVIAGNNSILEYSSEALVFRFNTTIASTEPVTLAVSMRVSNTVANGTTLYGGFNNFQRDPSPGNTGTAMGAFNMGWFLDPPGYDLVVVATEGGSASGGGRFGSGEVVQVSATPSLGYVFSHWSGDASGSENPLTVLMDSDKTITANFVLDTGYDLVVTAGTGGGATGGGHYENGSTATITAIADPGYVFSDWSGDASGSSNPSSVLVDRNKAVQANFAPDTSDPDNDGLNTYQEAVVFGTSPTDDDTDDDGLKDGYEIGVGRFQVVLGYFTWITAKADAESRGGYLATFVDQGEWDAALAGLGPDPFALFTGLWIGATDAATEGVWQWITNEPFTFSHWATSQPDNVSNADHVEVCGGYGALPGFWFDTPGAAAREGYILETGYATDPLAADSDDDGLLDGAEKTAGSNPLLADTDNDGLTDGQEVHLTGTNPVLPDTDSDGTNDALDDQDGDGLGNLAEIATYGTDPKKDDTDNDGVKDGTELAYAGSRYSFVAGTFTHAQAAADAVAHTGRLAAFPAPSSYQKWLGRIRAQTQASLWIGLDDAATEGSLVWSDGSACTYTRWATGQPDGGTSENFVGVAEGTTQWHDLGAVETAGGYVLEVLGLDPLVADTDGDGLQDGAEINTHHSSPVDNDTDGDSLSDGMEVNTTGSDPTKSDTDGDGWSDAVEVNTYGTNPAKADTDDDGFEDPYEVDKGYDPKSAASTPEARVVMRTAVELKFEAARNVSYFIESSTNLMDWTTVETGILGEGKTVSRLYSTEGIPKRSFRARRE